MKRLFLLRHAKSSWDEAGLADRDRPLAPRGRRATQVMARHLRDENRDLLGPTAGLPGEASGLREVVRQISRELLLGEVALRLALTRDLARVHVERERGEVRL